MFQKAIIFLYHSTPNSMPWARGISWDQLMVFVCLLM